MGLHVQVVTSAVRPIPAEWARIPRLSIVVSIDGLQPEHDVRRAPATYDRILKHIVGQQIVVHCTVTRQLVARDGYLREFAEFWSGQQHVRKIWFSLYTPQLGEESAEKLRPADRRQVVKDLLALRVESPELQMPKGLIDVYGTPPDSPDDCIFSRVTHTLSADLRTKITPCQFGGAPDCSNCGCIASAGLAAIGRHRLFGFVPIDPIFDASFRVGRLVRRLRGSRGNGARSAAAPPQLSRTADQTSRIDRPVQTMPDQDVGCRTRFVPNTHSAFAPRNDRTCHAAAAQLYCVPAISLISGTMEASRARRSCHGPPCTTAPNPRRTRIPFAGRLRARGR